MDDCRFGLSLDPERSESSWHFVTKDYGIMLYGLLAEEQIVELENYIKKREGLD